MTLELRPACVLDLPAVYRGEQDYIRCWEPDHEAAWRLQLEKHLTLWVENFDRLIIATMDGQFAGYALWMTEQDCAELCTINVAEAFRRQGIGQTLLEDYVTTARRQGFSQLGLSVREDNPARLMYEKAGFVRAGNDAHGYIRYQRLG